MVTKINCTQNNGNCETCSLGNYGLNCENKPITECFIFDIKEMQDGPGRTGEIRVCHVSGNELDCIKNPKKYYGPNFVGLSHFYADGYSYQQIEETDKIGKFRTISNSSRIV